MKALIFSVMILISSSLYGQEAPKVTEAPKVAEENKAKPKKPPVDVAELIFKRMDSNKNGSISLKEFKAAFPRLRKNYSQGSGRSSSPAGRTRGFDGKTPSFRPEGSSRSRGRSSRSYRGSSRGRSK